MSPNSGPTGGPQNVGFDDWQTSPRSFKELPPWLVPSAAEFGSTQRVLDVVRPIRAFSFGGILVFGMLLGFLIGHSPDGQNLLLVVAMCGLPLSVAAWFVASRVERRMNYKKNRIQQRMFDAGLRLEDDGRVQTDDPHPLLILDAAGKETDKS